MSFDDNVMKAKAKLDLGGGMALALVSTRAKPRRRPAAHSCLQWRSNWPLTQVSERFRKGL